MQPPYTLYGLPASLYTGKVRAYMRRNHINFIEKTPRSERFNSVIRKTIGRWIIPVLETPDGEFIQDGSKILDYFESKGCSANSIFPTDPRLKVIAHLFELFGGEGLLRQAMHYRWNFDDTNLSFIKSAFAEALPDTLGSTEWEELFKMSSGRMRQAAVYFGVTPEIFPTIEESYVEILSLLNDHFGNWPYLLGGFPTAGDYGLFNPLYAHLGRDPKPLHIMQTIAPNVFRWTERMNAPEDCNATFSQVAKDELFADFSLPDTLKALLRFVSTEYLQELTAHTKFANTWLNENPIQTHDPKSRIIGFTEFKWRGHTIKTAVMTYRFFLLQRLHDTFDAMEKSHQSNVRELLSETKLESILDLRTKYRVVRRNHLEHWE